MTNLTHYIGNELKTNNGDIVQTSVLMKERSFVGLYFAAEWCKDFDKFTEKLIFLQNEVPSDSQENKTKLDIVVISSDKSEEDFDSYFSKLSVQWYAIQYADRYRKVQYVSI